jgi:CPA2 family monovalent cation:H+ antiporter-2
VLVLEDLAMAAYLPLVAVLITGGTVPVMLISVVIAITVVTAVLFVAIRYGQRLSRFAAHQSDEVILLSILGAVLLVAGLMQRLQVSAAIGAFLVGTALSGPIAKQSHRLLAPLRDLFAATFFFFFGLEIDPASLLPVLPAAILLGMVTTFTKIGAGYWAARRQGVDSAGRWRAGVALVARGEFSIVIAGLGIGIEAGLGPVAAAYVLLLAIGGPILSRLAP